MSELGLERLEARWMKLKLLYWRRILVMEDDRITKRLAMEGVDQLVSGKDGGNRWAAGMKGMLEEVGLRGYWENRLGPVRMVKESWKSVVYEAVEQVMLKRRREGLGLSFSGARYDRIRYWGRIPPVKARARAEINRSAHRSVPRFLDEWMSHRGPCRLKLAFRSGTFPTVGRLTSMGALEDTRSRCLMCGRQSKETIEHIILECEAYAESRGILEEATRKIVSRHRPEVLTALLGGSKAIRMQLWLGDWRDVDLNRFMDRKVKIFLRKVWRKRRPLARVLDQMLGRQDCNFLEGKVG